MNDLTGQLIYCGPTIPQIGLQMGMIFRKGVYPSLAPYLEACPALRGLFVPPAERAAVRKELDFDIARNMRGTTGKYVTFFREVQKWLKTGANPTPATNIKE